MVAAQSLSAELACPATGEITSVKNAIVVTIDLVIWVVACLLMAFTVLCSGILQLCGVIRIGPCLFVFVFLQ